MARTGTTPSQLLQTLGNSTVEDQAFLPFDIQGSIAHVMGLRQVGLIENHQANTLIAALQAIPNDWQLDPTLEDVHMNIEAQIHQQCGPVGKTIHTGRSRNDQVATCITLFVRHELLLVADNATKAITALQAQTKLNSNTAWIARTHGKPAQPATIAFLLHAHTTRLIAFLSDVAHVLEQNRFSPLGSGAVAGSTLPLDPAFTASLLGLEPSPNALAATGTKDTSRRALDLTAFGGRLIADLAQDLLSASTPATHHTTGSSLMPHKRNPDALELLRGHAQSLVGPAASVAAITSGLGLGYQRDLQATKPALLAICQLADLFALLTEVVTDSTFAPATLDDPGLLATDMAEALVADGVAFRDAYAAVAAVFQATESGIPFAQAVENLPCDVPIADPSKRITLGAPGNLPALEPAFAAARAQLNPHRIGAAKAAALVLA